MVNPKTLLDTESLLRPLGKLMPGSVEERLDWRLNSHAKDAHFDVEWGIQEDSRLLLGIYKHGLGSWEQVKLDKDLDLSDKMLLNANCKPQSKHLDLRAAYLLRVLSKSEEKVKKGKRGARKSVQKPREEKEESKEYKSVAIIENSDSSDSDSEKKEVKEKKEKPKEVKEKKDTQEKKEKKPKTKRPKTAAELGPVHITGSKEPVLVGELDPAIFAQCKEKMRSVKKALKALDKPDPNMSQDEQVTHTRKCLIKIGIHIDKILGEMKDEKAKEWRSNLWFFVSKFTEFEATKLYKLYRHAVKKEGRGQKDDEKEKGEKKDKDRHKEKKRKEDKEHKKSHHHKKDPDRGSRPSVDDADTKNKERTVDKPNDRLVDKTNDRLHDTTNDRCYDRHNDISTTRADRTSQQKSGYDRRDGNERMGHNAYNGYDKGGYQERSGYNKGGYHQENRHNNSRGHGGGWGNSWRGDRGHGGGGYRDRGYEERGGYGESGGWNKHNKDRQHNDGYRSSTVIDGSYREGGGGYRENDYETHHDDENSLSRDASEAQL